MAQYEIAYSCGHNLTKQLYGPNKERQSYLTWAKDRGLCPACKAAKAAADHAAENAAAAETNAAVGLPALVGSPKQIAWAETIRAEALAKPVPTPPPEAKIAEQAAAKGITVDEMRRRIDLVAAAVNEARAELEGQASAKWWIDHRDTARFAVHRAFTAALEHAFSDRLAAEARAKDAQEAETRAAQAAQFERERLDAEERYAQAIAKANTFAVGDRPGSVEVRGSNVTIKSRDGRTAYAYIEDGDWCVYQIGDHALNSTHPEAERIAKEARENCK